ncbi:related to FMN-dependent 2-nitropropane dioxygenase [Ramularia collo-cygni]|uniref:Related to FMN-dependent 2-nitropropane dioxygenase n=1 Tax=Ramularia collo-cygni TaxID=112498 RepID=A0A2D3UNS7_9PEZI|nr:related to FMN-dependent 2-nitropropane dioxygenase [Ramularia collo-cygni]CZT15228.1 related to FMN-dependent 2-nitropropane dioxygenase [Ramularia collo-cygni]
MLGAATPTLAVNVSTAGGLGFIAGGTKIDALEDSLQQVAQLSRETTTTQIQQAPQDVVIPIGVGFQLWSCKLNLATTVFKKYVPAVAWLYAPTKQSELADWANGIREITQGKTHIWVQVGSVDEARSAVSLAKPDVLVIQGSDAGGHGLSQSASIISLVPEVMDMLAAIGQSDLPVLAAGGISDGRGVAGALALGASGVVMGTRFLAAQEAGISRGWQQEVVRLSDGGQTTIRSTLCDRLKETKGWPACYDGRAAINKGHEDEVKGMSDDENVALYKKESAEGESAWGPNGRMVTYAGTGVGLVRGTKPAAAIVDEVQEEARACLIRSGMSAGHENGRSKM